MEVYRQEETLDTTTRMKEGWLNEAMDDKTNAEVNNARK